MDHDLDRFNFEINSEVVEELIELNEKMDKNKIECSNTVPGMIPENVRCIDKKFNKNNDFPAEKNSTIVLKLHNSRTFFIKI